MYKDISSSICQEFLAYGFEPFSIPVLSFKFDNQQELTKKLENPSKYEGAINIIINQSQLFCL